jgi:PBP1b-binding outer membrane lipoprotein LpoB
VAGMRKIGSLFLFVVLFLGACSNENNPKEHIGEISAIALESLMEKDKALSSDI